MIRRTDSPNGKQLNGAWMRKRRLGQEEHGNYSERSGKRLEKQKHLYLALDDWNGGFTIRKLDADSNLTDPPVLRLTAPKPSRHMIFAAIGSTIFITPNPRCGQAPSLVYDTDTAALTTGPPLPEPLLGDSLMAVATADTLYAFKSYQPNRENFFEAMSWAPTGNDDPLAPMPLMDWSWRTVPSPPPFTKDEAVASCALHPDGRTIFVSASSYKGNRLAARTFSFDTDRLGDWALPFRGEGHFDGVLEVWVGLHEDGYVCACQVASPSRASAEPPECKIVKDRLFHKVRDGRRAAPDVSLAYMGDAKFCLVECVVREGVDYKYAFGDSDGCVLQVTTFGLKYSFKGELQTMNCDTNYYLVSKELPTFCPVAFWM